MSTDAAVWGRVQALLDLGRPQDALAEAQRALASDPENAVLWRVVSHIQTSLGAYRPALEAARRAVALDPQGSDAYRALGVALWNTGVLGRPVLALLVSQRLLRGGPAPALAALYTSLRLDPDDADTHVILAGLLLNLNRVKAATGHYQQALSLEPGNEDARIGLGRAALKRRRAAEAQAHALEVLGANPVSVDGLHLLARSQLRLRQPDQALRTALSAVRLDPGNAWAQRQFQALRDEYLPRPVSRVLLLEQAVVRLRNAYRLRRLSPEVRASLRQIRPPAAPSELHPVQRLVVFATIPLLALISWFASGDDQLDHTSRIFLTLIYSGLFLWFVWAVWQRSRKRR